MVLSYDQLVHRRLGAGQLISNNRLVSEGPDCAVDGWSTDQALDQSKASRIGQKLGSQPMNDPNPLVLVTGATGYVGGRLLPLLESRGLRIRCMARRPENIASGVGEGTEIVQCKAMCYTLVR